MLKSLALRLSDIALSLAFKPLAKRSASGISGLLFSGLFGGGGGASASLAAASGAIKPFAAGGVIGTPSYFPLWAAASALPARPGRKRSCRWRAALTAGSASPAAGRRQHHHTCRSRRRISTSFRRSESYITGQIARAVARGQRSL